MRLLLLSLTLCLMVFPHPAAAQSFVQIETETVRVCPVENSQILPDFDAENCHSEGFVTVDPQGRHIWMRATLNVDPDFVSDQAPMGLFISAKAASEIFFNGVRIGSIGQPGASRETERPGRMDGHVYVPTELIRSGENIIVLRLSSMHGVLNLMRPMHLVALGPFGDPRPRIIGTYWPSLITLGVFLLGFVFFGVTAIRGDDREGSSLLSLASLFAGSQLMAEASRGLFAYSYPFHDARLLLILNCAGFFGLCLLAYLLLRLTDFHRRTRILWVAGTAIIMLAEAALLPGFDVKTLVVLLTTSVIGMAGCAFGLAQHRPGALLALVGLAGTCGLIVFAYNLFLDVFFYYLAAALLLYLFYLQALAIVQYRRTRRAEEQRARGLELALAQARQQSAPVQLELIRSGRVEYVSTERIVQLKGAGDYVELHFEDESEALYNGSLGGLEDSLPASFIRVHRSHIVNTAFVKALEREQSGIGQLILSTGLVVPVSRRIMPSVKSALSEALS